MAVIVVPVVVGAEELLDILLIAAGIQSASKAIPKISTKTVEECKKTVHRGRIQAQGGGLEDSEKWTQDNPPSKAQGFTQLDSL